VAIGPRARYEASGRVVVVATLQGVIGFASAVVGLGPLIGGGGPAERVVGGIGMVFGAVMMVAALVVGLRLGPARTAGLLGGVVTCALGVLIVVLAWESVGACHAPGRSPQPCYVVVGGVAVAGFTVAGVGAASVSIVRRSRPEAFRRGRR